jgi:tetratricopeptide (TPR) repeat protein
MAAHEDGPGYRFQLAQTYNQLGLLYVRGFKKLPDGRAALKQAEALCEQLSKEVPAEPEYRSELAQTFANFMLLADFSGKYEQAVTDGERAVPVLEKLVHDYQRVADYQYRLAFVLSNIATAHCNNQHPDRALAACAKALPVAEQLVRAHPDVRSYKNRLAFLRIGRGIALAQQGDFRKAAAEIDAAAESDALEGMTLYNGACGYCLSATAASKDATLSPAERDKLAGHYLDRALAFLQRGKDTTPHFKSEQIRHLLKTDSDLEPLRQQRRPDFEKFRAQVEEQACPRK